MKLTNHRPDRSLVTLADEADVISCHARVTRNFTQPHVGMKSSPHLRLSRRTDKSRMAKPSLMSFLCQVDLAK